MSADKESETEASEITPSQQNKDPSEGNTRNPDQFRRTESSPRRGGPSRKRTRIGLAPDLDPRNGEKEGRRLGQEESSRPSPSVAILQDPIVSENGKTAPLFFLALNSASIFN